MTRIQISGALLLLLLSLAAVTAAVGYSPDAPFLLQRGFAAWITPPEPVFPATHIVQPGSEPAAHFRHAFRVGESVDAEIRVRALGTLALSMNGAPLAAPAEAGACLKRVCRERARLVAGENIVEARVRNPIGPPVLWLELDAGETRVASDTTWQVAMGDGPPLPAVRADDTRTYPDATAGPTSIERLGTHAGTLAALFMVSALVFLVGRRAMGPAAVARVPLAALVLLSLFWVGLYLVKFVDVPIESGYDARFHVRFVRHVAERGSLPEPLGGPAMYHPPLYYAATAAGLALFDPARGSRTERQLLGLLPFLSGLAMVWIGFAVARRLFDRDPRAVTACVLFAGLLPLNLYMSAYASNEPLHAALASGALCVLAGALLDGAPSTRRLAALSLLLGLACLTKYTALGLTALCVFFLGLKRLVADRAAPARVALGLLAVLAGVAAIAGWVYLRNWLRYGDPLVWNLTLPGGATWWQPPGFRTASYYAGFGESLRHPFFSGFHSFWDGIYATFWGEGLPPTAYTLEDRHGVWSYAWMCVVYWLALPATALLGVGLVRAVGAALRGEDLARRTVWTLFLAWIALLGLGLLQVSIRFPVWGGVRASYALSAVVPLAAVGALGFAWLDHRLRARGWTAARAVLYGWSGTLVGAIVLSFAG